MKFSQVLPLLPLASAFVVPEADTFENIEKTGREIIDRTQGVLEKTQHVLDDAFAKAVDGVKDIGDKAYHKIHETGCDVESWLEGSSFDEEHEDISEKPEHPHHPPHHGRPHHPPHHEKPNQTVYELISKSKYTTKLAKLIDEFPDLVDKLNSTKTNYTVFAPTDEAFEKIPKHGKKPSKEILEKVLSYHISDDFYPAGRVLHSYTIPTLLEPENLGHKQRLTVRVTLKGPTINFYSKLVAVNIFGTNGVIHGVDHIIVPPPQVATIIGFLPGEFSTLELALDKTGLFEKINSTDYPHKGGTFFAPSNFAFKKLGPRANAFLFSQYGLKYLKALLKYHIVVDQTLYSDAFFDQSGNDSEKTDDYRHFHVDLPTVLKDKYLSVDSARYGPFVEIRINAFSRVTVHDGVASDGVIQVVSDVLIPPKTEGAKHVYWTGDELDVEDLKERLAPLVEDNLEL
ncbi:FAS1 domain-containing protein [Bimuria novae-zelandiae CBS 107.79]|uniref:FAS1 domain-containing protein n=1 Tax=Bimuria novae-zelandiae CBS 107.79 TaxID=1447943 RepID=A0A6A5VJS3_9PLEO|nr:FAS1 domain-containing protein [Bimuria novae-zelandiae CBS 107.79]